MQALDVRSSSSQALPDANTREVTLVFCDIANFTHLTERLGDDASYRMVKRCEELAVSRARGLGGELLEVRGDGFLFAFESPVAAASCAVSIQREIELARDLGIQLHVGIHTGRVIHDGDRYFGRTMIAAFRVSALAHPDEILVSDETHERLPDAEFHFGRPRRVWLKGFAQLHRVWEIDWHAAAQPRVTPLRPGPRPQRVNHVARSEPSHARALGY